MPGMVVGMDEDEMLTRFQDKAEHHAREAERYRIAADVLRDELRSGRSPVRSVRPSQETGQPTDPRGSSMAMVEIVLKDVAAPLHPNDLVIEMERRGWQSTAAHKVNTVRTAAHRLAEQGRVTRIGDGRFAAMPPELPAVPERDLVTADGSGNAQVMHEEVETS